MMVYLEGHDSIMRRISLSTSEIKLDRFLKWAGLVSTGGQAKLLLQGNCVTVNGQPETRRGRKLYPGDEVYVQGIGTFRLEVEEGSPRER